MLGTCWLIFMNIIRVYTSLDPDKTLPNMGPNCLQRLIHVQANDKRRHRQAKSQETHQSFYERALPETVFGMS